MLITNFGCDIKSIQFKNERAVIVTGSKLIGMDTLYGTMQNVFFWWHCDQIFRGASLRSPIAKEITSLYIVIEALANERSSLN